MLKQTISAQAGSRGLLAQEVCAAPSNKRQIDATPQDREFQCAADVVVGTVGAWRVHCLTDGCKCEFHLRRACGGGYCRGA